MYNPAHFAEHGVEVLHAFVRENPLGIIVSHGQEGLDATHVPMVLAPQEGSRAVLRCHLARANPQWRTLAASPVVLVIFTGMQHYISPTWYASKQEHGKVVPTWNYATVQVRGQATLFEEQEQLVQHVREMTEQHEASFPVPWEVADAPRGYIEGLTKAIVGVEIAIDCMEGKWKLSQNRSLADQQGVREGLEKIGSADSLAMADAVRDRSGTPL